MNDIETRIDIDLLMRVFYERALADDVIGYIFSGVAKLDLEIGCGIIGGGGQKPLPDAGRWIVVQINHGSSPQNGIGSSWAVPVRSLIAPCASMLST